MRHRNHRHSLGVKKEHRIAMMSNLGAALFEHGRIETTITKAKALRPFAEKLITLAKNAATTDDRAKKLHYRRLALSKVRSRAAIKKLFDERASEFVDRPGGYTRIYKIGFRNSDATEMALIELIDGSDEGYKANRRKSSATRAAKAVKAEEKTADAAQAQESAEPAAVAADSEPPEDAKS